MPLDTNLNVTPYYDDFDETKNFHRVLFRPSLAVQARELTQLQTILQNQVERFGDNIFKTGTIIKGCNLTTDYSYYYIKIKDQLADGAPVSMASYSNTLLIQEASNLYSIVVNFKTGLQSQNPDLNTLYIKYINTGSSGEKSYSNNQTIKVFDKNRTIEDVIIVNGGTLYSNSDSVAFSGGGGSGAVAILTTDSAGKITDVSMTSKGTGYTTTPNVSITTSTGTSANVEAKNYIAEVVVANNSFTAPVGVGTAVKTTDGVIYQKGHFIRVDAQESVIQKYSPTPNNVVVGFATTEAIVNSNVDSSLLDLATGSPNYTAPGADRIKLTPVLTGLSVSDADANGDFLALLEYQDGNVVKDRTRTQYNYIGKELSKRTFEESGNYVLNTIQLNTADRPSNSTYFDLTVGSGTAYVNGERIEILNNIRVPVRKGTDTANATNQTINTQYGSYVVIEEMLGVFDIKTGATVSLRNTAADDVTDNLGGTPTSPGGQIGTALVRSLEYDSGIPGTPSCRYRLYLFDIRMASGFSFKDIRSISIASTAVADIVLNTSNNAELKDIENDILIFNTGSVSANQLSNEQFVFRTSTDSTFSLNGNVTISPVGGAGNTIPYGVGALSDSLIREFIIIPTQAIKSASNTTGTVAANTNLTNVTGTSTSFTTEYEVGDYIVIGNTTVNSTSQRITAIFNNNLMQLSGNFNGAANAVSNGIFKVYPANIPVDFTKPSKNVVVNSTTSLTVNLGHSINSTATFTMFHNMEKIGSNNKAKTIVNPTYVKLSTDRLANTTTGPWCLGVPDVLSIEAVYVGTGNTYSEATTNYANEFELNNGHKDNFYGLAYIKKAPGSTLSLTSSNSLLVKFKCFEHSTGQYISIDSYTSIIDDTTNPLPSNKIRTQDIPIYVSFSSGQAYSLRDSIDFRPIVANTAARSTTAAGATIDPSTTETLVAGEKFFPSPSEEFECDIQSFLPRVDRVVLGQDGKVRIVEGVSSLNPSAPQSERGSMDLGVINIAPYPSLSSKAASDAKRPDLKNTINLLQTRRYTMQDIGNIEGRIQRLEYYALLSTLEANTKSLTIPSDANNEIEVFKNGFFVDPFNNYLISNLDDGEYKAIIDTQRSRLIPQQEVINIDLISNTSSSSNITKTGNLLTLDFTEEELISQPRANKERTLVEQNYSFVGKMLVVPRTDNFFDTDVTATSAIDINIADPLNQLINAQNEINKTLTQSSQLLSTVNVSGARLVSTIEGRNFETSTFSQDISQTFRDTSTTLTATAPVVTSQQELGTFLTSVNVTPFIREQRIAIYISGLRPGAQHYVFFDNVDLTSNCAPASVTSTSNLSLQSFTPTANKLSSPGLFANNTGELAVIVDIPGNTFSTGEKDILIMDISTLTSESSATSKSTGRFSAFSLQGTSTTLTLSTSNFDLSEGGIVANTFSETRVVNSTISWTQTRTFDPLAQSFLVQKQKGGGDILYLTSVDVYFRNKDSEKGVSLELREVNESGYPTPFVLPFSRVYKTSSGVSVSNTALTATTFTFNSPVAVKVDKEYAIVLMPDNNSPDYRVWTSIPGLADVSNTSIIANESWGLGTLFFSTSNRSFSAVQNEDIKFTVRRANFSPTTGTAVLNNADYEFLTINSVSGSFIGGEDIAQMANSYLSANLTTNTTSYVIQTSSSLSSTLSAGDNVLIIYGTSPTLSTANVKAVGTSVSNASATTTNFTSEYSNGDFIVVGREIRQITNVNSTTLLTIDAPFNVTPTNEAHYNSTEKFDILRTVSANSTTFTVNRPPAYAVNTSTSNTASIQKVVKGTVSYYNSSKGKIYIKDSTSANSDFLIKTANSTYFGYLVGDTSDALAKVSSIDNVPGTIFTPLINTLIVPGTTVNFNASFTKLGGGTDVQNYTLGGKNVVGFNDSAIVKSKSNEIAGTTITKSFIANLSFSSAHSDSSPVIDINPSSIVVTKYNINNDSTNENTRYGNAQAKYISKRLVLNEGLDAEDIKVYLRAFKPGGTEIEVYAKILNSTDGESFEDKNWSELEQVTSSALYSSSLNDTDIKEYEYTFKKSPASTALTGKVQSNSNTTITGSSTTFNTDLVAGDIVKIVQASSTDSYDIIPVTSVTNDTEIILASNTSFSGSGLTIEKVTRPKEAFRYNRNDFIVRYFDSSEAAHDTYKYLAIKIVLKSPYTYLVPQVEDARVIAVSI